MYYMALILILSRSQLSKVVTFQYVQSVSSRTCAFCLGASVLLKVVVVEVMHTHMMPSTRVLFITNRSFVDEARYGSKA